MPLTLYDKIWNDHLVDQQEDGTALLFVDRHLVHEVTSPQAFEGLRNANRKVRQPRLTLAFSSPPFPPPSALFLSPFFPPFPPSSLLPSSSFPPHPLP